MKIDTINPTSLSAAFGSVIADLRFNQRLTQQELARISGLSERYVGALEKGAYRPSIVTVHSIALALKVDPWLLVERAYKVADKNTETQ